MKHEKFVNGMRKAGKLAFHALDFASNLIEEGVTPQEINDAVHRFTTDNGALSAPLNYKGYPKATCISVNEVLCHGIPNGIPLKNGDIVNIDVTVIIDGYHGDTSATYKVGTYAQYSTPIILAAREARDAGIKMIRPYGMSGDIGMASAAAAARHGFTVAPNLGGHGIGKEFHMKPHIPSSGSFGTGDLLLPWTCITVEPIIVSNPKYDTHIIENSTIEWYTTVDKSPAAQFEHTVLITDKGYEILTLP